MKDAGRSGAAEDGSLTRRRVKPGWPARRVSGSAEGQTYYCPVFASAVPAAQAAAQRPLTHAAITDKAPANEGWKPLQLKTASARAFAHLAHARLAP